MRSISVIDIGTNTTRLLIKNIDNPSVDVVRMIRITKLGYELETTGKLSLRGQDDTLHAIFDYIEVSQSYGISTKNIHIFATAAARRASNGKEFIENIEKQTGCHTLIISGEQEGNASFLGAMGGMSEKVPTVVFDIGGGSTELAVSSSDMNSCSNVFSLPIGSVVATKHYIENDPPLAEELSRLILDVRDQLKEIQVLYPDIDNTFRWVGVAATVTTVAAVEIGLHEFNFGRIHEFIITRQMAEEVFRTLATEPLNERIHNPGLEEQRAEVIIGGVAILVSIMRQFELNEITVSCTDLLDGLWLSVVENLL